MITTPLLAILVAQAAKGDVTFASAVRIYVEAARRDQLIRLEQSKGDQASTSFVIGKPTAPTIPGFAHCSNIESLQSGRPYARSAMCLEGYPDLESGYAAFADVARKLEAIYPLDDGYHADEYSDGEILTSANLRHLQVRRSTNDPVFDLTLVGGATTGGSGILLAITPGHNWVDPYALGSLRIEEVPSDSPTLSDGYCELDYRDGRYVLQTTPLFWTQQVPPLLREFFLLHERSHMSRGHILVRMRQNLTDDELERQETQADQDALANLAIHYRGSFSAVASHIRAEAGGLLHPTYGHPVPSVRVQDMLREVAEAQVLWLQADDQGTPIDETAMRVTHRPNVDHYEIPELFRESPAVPDQH